MSELPKCRWRGIKQPNDRYSCGSLKVIAPKGVTAETCATRCTFCDHEPSAEPPGLVKQAINFAVAAAQHLAAGLPQATQEEHDRRLSICKGCEHFQPANNGCKVCGCTGLKLEWAEQSCPLKLW